MHGVGTVIGKSVIKKGAQLSKCNFRWKNGKLRRLDADGKVRGMSLFESDCIVYAGAIVVRGITVKANTVIKAGSIV